MQLPTIDNDLILGSTFWEICLTSQSGLTPYVLTPFP